MSGEDSMGGPVTETGTDVAVDGGVDEAVVEVWDPMGRLSRLTLPGAVVETVADELAFALPAVAAVERGVLVEAVRGALLEAWATGQAGVLQAAGWELMDSANILVDEHEGRDEVTAHECNLGAPVSDAQARAEAAVGGEPLPGDTACSCFREGFHAGMSRAGSVLLGTSFHMTATAPMGPLHLARFEAAVKAAPRRRWVPGVGVVRPEDGRHTD